MRLSSIQHSFSLPDILIRGLVKEFSLMVTSFPLILVELYFLTCAKID